MLRNLPIGSLRRLVNWWTWCALIAIDRVAARYINPVRDLGSRACLWPEDRLWNSGSLCHWRLTGGHSSCWHCFFF